MSVKAGKFILFDDTESEMNEILREVGALDFLSKLPDESGREELQTEAVTALRAGMEIVQTHDLNKAGGKPSVKIGSYHFHLHKMVKSAFVTGIKIGWAILLAKTTGDPHGLAQHIPEHSLRSPLLAGPSRNSIRKS